MRNAILGVAAVAAIALLANTAQAQRDYGSRHGGAAAIHTISHNHDRYDDHHGSYSSHGRHAYYPSYHGRYPAVPGHPQIISPYHYHPPIAYPPAYRRYGSGCGSYGYPHNSLYYRGTGFGFSFSF